MSGSDDDADELAALRRERAAKTGNFTIVRRIVWLMCETRMRVRLARKIAVR